MRGRTSSNGGRTGPENEKPKMASRITSVSLREERRSDIEDKVGMDRLLVCFCSR